MLLQKVVDLLPADETVQEDTLRQDENVQEDTLRQDENVQEDTLRRDENAQNELTLQGRITEEQSIEETEVMQFLMYIHLHSSRLFNKEHCLTSMYTCR